MSIFGNKKVDDGVNEVKDENIEEAQTGVGTGENLTPSTPEGEASLPPLEPEDENLDDDSDDSDDNQDDPGGEYRAGEGDEDDKDLPPDNEEENDEPSRGSSVSGNDRVGRCAN